MRLRLSTTAVAIAALAFAGYASAQGATAANTLVAAKVATAPSLNAGATDAAWAGAKPISVKLSGGENFGGTGSTTATLKAVYSGDMIYMLIQYADPTNSVRRGPFQKQADGSWKKLSDPKNKGGDDNVYYEDKWAFLWPINNSVKGFDQSGCGAMCHAGEEGKPYGNKYTTSEGEIADMWHMKGGRTAPLGNVDDQYTDHTRFDAKTAPNAGRKSDPGGPEYANIDVVAGKPAVMNKDGKPGNAGGAYYIVKGDEVPFDDTKFKAGDEVRVVLHLPAEGRSGRHQGRQQVERRRHDLGHQPQARDGQQVRRPVQRPGRQVPVRLRRVRQRAGSPRGSLRPALPDVRQVAFCAASGEGGPQGRPRCVLEGLPSHWP